MHMVSYAHALHTLSLWLCTLVGVYRIVHIKSYARFVHTLYRTTIVEYNILPHRTYDQVFYWCGCL